MILLINGFLWILWSSEKKRNCSFSDIEELYFKFYIFDHWTFCVIHSYTAKVQITLLVLMFIIKWLNKLASIHHLTSALPLSRLQNVRTHGSELNYKRAHSSISVCFYSTQLCVWSGVSIFWISFCLCATVINESQFRNLTFSLNLSQAKSRITDYTKRIFPLLPSLSLYSSPLYSRQTKLFEVCSGRESLHLTGGHRLGRCWSRLLWTVG